MFYHLKIFLRNLRRDKFYSIINIGGLAIGMAASALLLIWVYNQWSSDRFHTKAEQIYMVWNKATYNGQDSYTNYTSLVIGPALEDEYPEIVESARVSRGGIYYFGEGERHISMRTLHTDPSFLTMFDFPLLQGDIRTALNDPYSIILTEKAARRIFGDEDPMGKTIMCDAKYPVTVMGIMKDLPNNTRFDFEIVGSIQFVEKVHNWNTTSWWVNMVETYVEVAPHVPLARLNASICDIIKNHTEQRAQRETFLFPSYKSHLYRDFENGVPSRGLITFLRIFTILASVILLIACINFVNLSTARATLRAKEVGVRKVMGGRRIGLIGHFLRESIVLASVSGVIAFLLIYMALPYFSEWLSGFSGKVLSLDIFDRHFWVFAVGFILFTGLLAGCYPAFYLSGFRPVKVLKGDVHFGGRITLRKTLVVFQFFVTVILIIGALTLRKQIVYAQDRQMGWDNENLIRISLTDEIRKHYPAFRNDLMASGAVTDVTKTNAPMSTFGSLTDGIKWQGKDPDAQQFFDYYFADGNWAEMMGVELVAGRYPDPATRPADSTAFLLNETAVKIIGFENPIGETISFWGQEGQVAGVIKDLVLHPFENIHPLVVGCNEKVVERTTVHIRLSPGKTADKLSSVESIYRKYNPAHPFDYRFIDEEYVATHFAMVKPIKSLADFFTIITILISCMGMFALAALTAERRKKEVGIRKVLGASIANISLLISREYLVLTGIAFVIAAPLAWFMMNQLLMIFPYRTNITVWLIMAVGVLILLIAILTVGFQTVKVATSNPVKAIKTE